MQSNLQAGRVERDVRCMEEKSKLEGENSAVIGAPEDEGGKWEIPHGSYSEFRLQNSCDRQFRLLHAP
jgi:hypothetical protein